MQYRNFVLSAALAAVPFQSVPAAESDIVVTATRTAQTVDETLAPVTVISRDDIVDSQARSVPELLRSSTGIETANQGGYGKLTGVFLRGTNSDHVLVLVDGVRVGSATTGTADLATLPLSQIERIEIVRGPQSSLYGADALGGVIQIFTREGRKGRRLQVEAGSGSNQTHSASVDLSAGDRHMQFNVNASNFDTAGIDAINGVEPDADGYRNQSLSGQLRWHLSNSLQAKAQLLRSEAHNQYDNASGPAGGNSSSQQNVMAVEVDKAFGGNASTLRIARTEDLLTNDGVSFVAQFDTRRDQLTLKNDAMLNRFTLMTVGADYWVERVDSSTAFNESSRDNLGVFLQAQGDIKHQNLRLGLRSDDNEAFGQHTTGNVAWGYNLDPFRVSLSYGTGFKAPTFLDLYYPGASNPNLDPEQSQSMELAIQGDHGAVQWSLRGFRTDIDDLIVFDINTFAPGNVNRARIDGAEAELSVNGNHWRATANYTALDPRDRDTDNLLPRRSKQVLSVDLATRFGPAGAAVGYSYHGKRYDDKANSVKLDAYQLVGLRGHYQINKQWWLGARIENLLDENYTTATAADFLTGNVYPYRNPGRKFFATVRYTLQ